MARTAGGNSRDAEFYLVIRDSLIAAAALYIACVLVVRAGLRINRAGLNDAPGFEVVQKVTKDEHQSLITAPRRRLSQKDDLPLSGFLSGLFLD